MILTWIILGLAFCQCVSSHPIQYSIGWSPTGKPEHALKCKPPHCPKFLVDDPENFQPPSVLLSSADEQQVKLPTLAEYLDLRETRRWRGNSDDSAPIFFIKSLGEGSRVSSIPRNEVAINDDAKQYWAHRQ